MLPYPFPGPFDYRIPEGLVAEPGDLVLVPLNKRDEVGVVWDGPSVPTGDANPVPEARLRSIIAIIDSPPMRDDLRRLVRQYNRAQENVFPNGNFFKTGKYGTEVAFPVPDAERTNPNFHGCIDRKA